MIVRVPGAFFEVARDYLYLDSIGDEHTLDLVTPDREFVGDIEDETDSVTEAGQNDIASIAARHVDRIIEAYKWCNPNEPIRVVGYSFGGLLARHIVSELRSAGLPAFGIMLDTPGVPPTDVSSDKNEVINTLNERASEIVEMHNVGGTLEIPSPSPETSEDFEDFLARITKMVSATTPKQFKTAGGTATRSIHNKMFRQFAECAKTYLTNVGVAHRYLTQIQGENESNDAKVDPFMYLIASHQTASLVIDGENTDKTLGWTNIDQDHCTLLPEDSNHSNMLGPDFAPHVVGIIAQVTQKFTMGVVKSNLSLYLESLLPNTNSQLSELQSLHKQLGLIIQAIASQELRAASSRHLTRRSSDPSLKTSQSVSLSDQPNRIWDNPNSRPRASSDTTNTPEVMVSAAVL